MKMPSWNVGCVLIPLIVLAPTLVFPQDEQGTVKADSLAVYSEMSAESDVVKTLAKGTVVQILLTVTGDEGNWCSVANQDGSSRIGYVPCSGLDRPKNILPAAARNSSLPQVLIGKSYTPAKTSKRQTHGGDDGSLVGQTLAEFPGYSWSTHLKTLVIACRIGCPYCRASMPFYRQLGEQEKSNMLRAHVLFVMPNDEPTGSNFLREQDVDVEGIFGQELSALNVPGTPTLLLLDSSGRIQREWVGQLPPGDEKEVMTAAEK